jgi:hypothetical protein
MAQKANNLTRMQIYGDAINSLDAAERNRDIAHLDQWCSRIGHGGPFHFTFLR